MFLISEESETFALQEEHRDMKAKINLYQGYFDEKARLVLSLLGPWGKIYTRVLDETIAGLKSNFAKFLLVIVLHDKCDPVFTV